MLNIISHIAHKIYMFCPTTWTWIVALTIANTIWSLYRTLF